MTNHERRTDQRGLQRFLVRFVHNGEIRLAFSHDISSGGMFLKTKSPLVPGTDLRLLVKRPGGSETRQGVVVWSRRNLLQPGHHILGSGVGIRFAPTETGPNLPC